MSMLYNRVYIVLNDSCKRLAPTSRSKIGAGRSNRMYMTVMMCIKKSKNREKRVYGRCSGATLLRERAQKKSFGLRPRRQTGESFKTLLTCTLVPPLTGPYTIYIVGAHSDTYCGMICSGLWKLRDVLFRTSTFWKVRKKSAFVVFAQCPHIEIIKCTYASL